MGAGRFFGWVTGGTLPAALAADWLVSAWDQNAAVRLGAPGVTAVEDVAAGWLLDLLGLPVGSSVGFLTGATMANFVGLAAGRERVLSDAGWDLDRFGLCGAPRVQVLASADRHSSIDVALRYLGLGAPIEVAVDDQGRMCPSALAAALEGVEGPAMVILQAGNLHSGAFDPLDECIRVTRTHIPGAWVHIDGAFGLWAAASPRHRSLTAGHECADSWATDAHKTLNVPYDCGIAVVSDPEAAHAALGATGAYLAPVAGEPADPYLSVPEFSRRARGIPVWAALRSLGRDGVAQLVERLVSHASALAEGAARVPGARVLNEVVFTQVVIAFESDERTREVVSRVLADGTTWMSGSRWRGQDVLRISVSNWATDDEDVAASLAALKRAAAD